MSNTGIDNKKVLRIINKILELEKDNLKTKKYNNDEMVNEIKKIIEEEVNKCY